MSAMLAKIEDYLAMGVPEVWLVDPPRRAMFVANSSGLAPVHEFWVPEQPIRICAEEVFRRYEELIAR